MTDYCARLAFALSAHRPSCCFLSSPRRWGEALNAAETGQPADLRSALSDGVEKLERIERALGEFGSEEDSENP
jgi:hypothetical protein